MFLLIWNTRQAGKMAMAQFYGCGWPPAAESCFGMMPGELSWKKPTAPTQSPKRVNQPGPIAEQHVMLSRSTTAISQANVSMSYVMVVNIGLVG